MLPVAGFARGQEQQPRSAAVFSVTSNGYRRVSLGNDTLKEETYVFGEGGLFSEPGSDDSLRRLSFVEIAGQLVPELQKQNYVQSRDANATDLLIVVFWGGTIGSEDIGSDIGVDGSNLELLSIENRLRELQDTKNSGILGYGADLYRANTLPHMALAHQTFQEIGESRFFVVLKAYDFKFARKERKLKLLWQTRLSIRARGADFDAQLSSMLKQASKFFGQTTPGLVRDQIGRPKVEIGEAKVVEEDVSLPR